MNMKRQQGLALVTVLLIMALVVMLSASMLRSHQLLIASVSNQTEASRGLQLLLAAEQRALVLMRERLPKDTRVIHGEQPWAQAQTFMLDEVRLEMRIEDLAGRFNLGALTRNRKPDPVLLERWLRLCRALGVAPPNLEALHGQPFFDISQLRDLPGANTELLDRLTPWVTVLPAEAGLNVNTADAQVLGALENVTPAIAQRLVESRPEDGYASVQAFLAAPLLDGQVATGRGLAVGSRWFGVTLQVDLDARRMYLYSEVEMNFATQRPTVLRRAFSTVRQAGAE